ncbi:Aldehyde/histidinol dehydrogenase [Rhypophila decipiens]|uniref:Aldehyde/histidinol dehydrogenase n=1 Tax=Rhypophila decipiens TaxID=261697 RepID=A0AAN6YJ83_9PEZI|nr:Aldehyde/histidinol dehydrogenase [Rhypophila decipiens]
MAFQLEGHERENNTTTKQALQRVAESVTDGRAENVGRRQEQLFSLHTTLARDASAICHALALKTKGSRHDEAKKEAEVEYYLALDAVRHFYDSLDFDKELENEYRVANGKDYQSRRVGYGLVVIRPLEHHSRFYSIIVPLAAALSAGNCVVVEMPKSRPGDENYDIDIQLRTILARSLDSNIFCFADDIEEDFSKSDLESDFVLVVDQRSWNSSESSISARNYLVSLSDAPALAIVDRTADIKEAVRLIARASLIFGGNSPYAPDLVLVNEFVKDQVLDAFSETPDVKVEVHDFTDRSYVIAKVESNGQRDTGPIAVLPYSGLVDAVSMIKPSTQLLAGYFFAEPRAAKYLSQHLPCAISYMNQIPTHLLVGPAAPAVTATTSSPGLLYRYTRNMFSRPRPQMSEPPPRAFSIIDHHLGRANGGDSANSTGFLERAQDLMTNGEERLRNRQSLVSQATKPLKPVVRPNNEDVGFFEAGFLLAAGLVVLPVLGWGSFAMGRRLLSS